MVAGLGLGESDGVVAEHGVTTTFQRIVVASNYHFFNTTQPVVKSRPARDRTVGMVPKRVNHRPGEGPAPVSLVTGGVGLGNRVISALLRRALTVTVAEVRGGVGNRVITNLNISNPHRTETGRGINGWGGPPPSKRGWVGWDWEQTLMCRCGDTSQCRHGTVTESEVKNSGCSNGHSVCHTAVRQWHTDAGTGGVGLGISIMLYLYIELLTGG